MEAVKTVLIPYEPNDDVLNTLQIFRGMVNYCISVGLERKITSRFRLSNEVYKKLTKCGLHSWYVLGAIEVATAILKNYRKANRKGRNVKRPYARRLVAKLGNQAYRVDGNRLRTPIKPRQYFYIKLHKRVMEFLSDPTLKLGSITLTTSIVGLVFSKTAEVVEPEGHVAYDINEASIDGAYIKKSKAKTLRFDLSEIVKVKHGYFDRVRRVQPRYAKDRRVIKKIQQKWFKNQGNRVNSTLHQIRNRQTGNGEEAGHHPRRP